LFISNRYSSFKEFKYFTYRAHLETVFHKKIARRLREIRNDTIWIDGEDVTMAFKPMKMGLRVANLVEPWLLFKEKYMRVRSTFQELYKIEISDEDIKEDLENLK
jgi:hypothetical protein